MRVLGNYEYAHCNYAGRKRRPELCQLRKTHQAPPQKKPPTPTKYGTQTNPLKGTAPSPVHPVTSVSGERMRRIPRPVDTKSVPRVWPRNGMLDEVMVESYGNMKRKNENRDEWKVRCQGLADRQNTEKKKEDFHVPRRKTTKKA